MELNEFCKEIEEKSSKIDINLDNEICNKLYNYMNLLLEWNEKINLTAITDEKEIILKHFIDSFTINKFINSGDIMLDIGTGAGFPGLPIKIIRAEVDVFLMDSLNKRINFLNEVIESLQLKNIEAFHSRAEEMAKNYGKENDEEFLKNENVRNYIKEGLTSEKALEFLVKNAKIK